MRFYLYATGSTCYDKSGITFPVKRVLALEALVIACGGTNVKWENQFEWSNLPEVLCFDCADLSKINVAIGELKVSLFVRRYWV